MDFLLCGSRNSYSTQPHGFVPHREVLILSQVGVKMGTDFKQLFGNNQLWIVQTSIKDKNPLIYSISVHMYATKYLHVNKKISFPHHSPPPPPYSVLPVHPKWREGMGKLTKIDNMDSLVRT